MMKFGWIRRPLFLLPLLLSMFAIPAGAEERPAAPSREEVRGGMAIPSEGELVRGLRDGIGFVRSRRQAEALFPVLAREEFGRETLPSAGPFVAAVCPHDDHLYAGHVYLHAIAGIRAPRVLLVGVFHAARLWNLEGRLVFDRYTAWHAPLGPVRVDPLREELLAALPEEDVVIDDGMQDREHSLEAIVPFLQWYGGKDKTIVPVLVPYVSWQRLGELADHLAEALAGTIRRHGWRLGRDVAIVISSDAVHYGPDFDHAPFGTDAAAHERAVARDRELARSFLAGSLAEERLRGLYEELVDPANPRQYRIPWCGRFSVPFGLELTRRTAAKLGLPVPVGRLLRYGTSLTEKEPDVPREVREEGLGYTAPSNFHHFVGYLALGVELPGTNPERPASPAGGDDKP